MNEKKSEIKEGIRMKINEKEIEWKGKEINESVRTKKKLIKRLNESKEKEISERLRKKGRNE